MAKQNPSFCGHNSSKGSASCAGWLFIGQVAQKEKQGLFTVFVSAFAVLRMEPRASH
jgi:hypothetical protein